MECLICSRNVFSQHVIVDSVSNNFFTQFCQLLSIDFSQHNVSMSPLNLFCGKCLEELNDIYTAIKSLQQLELKVANFKTNLENTIISSHQKSGFHCQYEYSGYEVLNTAREIRYKIFQELRSLHNEPLDNRPEDVEPAEDPLLVQTSPVDEIVIKTDVDALDAESLDSEEPWTDFYPTCDLSPVQSDETSCSFSSTNFTQNQTKTPNLSNEQIELLKAKAKQNEMIIKIKRLEDLTEQEINSEIQKPTSHQSLNPYPFDYNCYICEKSFKHRKSLTRHNKVKRHPTNEPELGEPPSQKFSNTNKTYSKSKYSKFKYIPRKTCSLCDFEYTNSKDYKTHYKTHKVNGRIQCSICDKSISAPNFRYHMRIHQGDTKFKCLFCDKGFFRSTILNEHLRKHTKEKPFKCQICKKSFRVQDTFNTHQRTHMAEFNFKTSVNERIQCELCGKEMGENNLKYHMRSHNEDEKLKCPSCPKTFIYDKAFKDHLRIHTGETPFECKTCNLKFHYRTAYNGHVRWTHKGIRPKRPVKTFVCEICGKTIGILSKKLHMKIHNKEKDFVCSLCPKSFYKQSLLTYHMRSHTGENPFLCTVCGKGFTVGYALNQHMKNHNLPAAPTPTPAPATTNTMPFNNCEYYDQYYS